MSDHDKYLKYKTKYSLLKNKIPQSHIQSGGEMHIGAIRKTGDGIEIPTSLETLLKTPGEYNIIHAYDEDYAKLKKSHKRYNKF